MSVLTNPHSDTRTNDEIRVLLADDDETWARTQRRMLERQNERLVIETVHNLSTAQAAFESALPDCIICDYQLGDGTALELLAAVRENHEKLPFIIVTGRGDEAVASTAIGENVTDYVRKVRIGEQPELLCRRIESTVKTFRAEHALVKERQSKEALLQMVTESSTYTELADDVCQYLVTNHQYTAAWIGIPGARETITPIATAGDDEYVKTVLEEGTNHTASEPEPAIKALKQNISITTSMARHEPSNEPNSAESESVNEGSTESNTEPNYWKQLASERNFQSAGAVSIEHNGVQFGVLAVYSTVQDRITEDEITLLHDHADTIGYALQAINQKETLLSTKGTEAEFVIEDSSQPAVALWKALPGSPSIEVTTVIPRNENEVLYLTTITGVSKQALTQAATSIESVISVDIQESDDDKLYCNVTVEMPVPEVTITQHGGQFQRSTLSDERAQIAVSFPDNASAKEVETALTDTYEHVSTSLLRTEPTQQSSKSDIDYTPLTDRQKEVLELAFRVGYFERPRGKNTGEVATMLDISPATFTQHLRAAERKILENTIDDLD